MPEVILAPSIFILGSLGESIFPDAILEPGKSGILPTSKTPDVISPAVLFGNLDASITPDSILYAGKPGILSTAKVPDVILLAGRLPM